MIFHTAETYCRLIFKFRTNYTYMPRNSATDNIVSLQFLRMPNF